MKRKISLILAFTMAFSFSTLYTGSANANNAVTSQDCLEQFNNTETFPDPSVSYTTITENEFVYHVYDDFALLDECTDEDITEVEIPGQVNGVPVTGISSSPFTKCGNLKKITLPDSFEHFDWISLIDTTSIVKTVRVSFSGSVITNHTEEINVEEIPEFESYSKVSSNTVHALTANESENEHKELQDDDLPNHTVSEIAVSENNPYFTAHDGILYSKDMKTLIGCPPAKDIKELTLPEQTTTINDYAFYDCRSLEKAVIPDNIETINLGTFAFCINLKSIEFPESINAVTGYTCYKCQSLSDVKFKGTLEKIGINAFQECTSLKSFDIPDTVSYVGTMAFDSCGCIENADGVHYVSNWVTGSDENIEKIEIREGTAGIADKSFMSLSNVTSISIPSSVKHINYLAFILLRGYEPARIDYRCSFMDDMTLSGARAAKDIYIYDPECIIADSKTTINDNYKLYSKKGSAFSEVITGETIIHGYENSTAQAYAEKHGRHFEVIETASDNENNSDPEGSALPGDVNSDGVFGASDIMLFQQWLLSVQDAKINDTKAADFNSDGSVNIIDLCYMKKALIENQAEEVSDIINSNFAHKKINVCFKNIIVRTVKVTVLISC